MKNLDEESVADRKLDAAMRIIGALTDGNLEPDLKARMQEWFRNGADEELKQEAFEKYALEHLEPHTGRLRGDALKRYDKLAGALGLQSEHANGEPWPKRFPGFKLRYWHAAAVLIPAAGVCIAVFLMKSPAQSVSEMTLAGADHFREVFLPDSSYVSVSPGSTLVYRERGGVREVLLTGETFFKVRNDGEKPFSVSAPGVKVNVVGTDFFVSNMPGSPFTSISLFSGNVSVDFAGDSVEIAPGETLCCDNLTEERLLTTIDSDEMIAKGYKPRLKFDMVPLGQILRALSAVFEIMIETAPDIDADNGKYSVNLEDKSLEEALVLLAAMDSNTLAYKIEINRVSITRI